MNSSPWSTIRDCLGVSFLTHISENDYPLKLKYNNKLETICLFWIVSFLSYFHNHLQCFPFLDCINWNLTAIHFLIYFHSPNPIQEMGPNNFWFQVVPNGFLVWSYMGCFYSVSLISPTDISVFLFVCLRLLLLLVSLVSFLHRTILVIFEDDCSVKYQNIYCLMIKSSRRYARSLLYRYFIFSLLLFSGSLSDFLFILFNPNFSESFILGRK